MSEYREHNRDLDVVANVPDEVNGMEEGIVAVVDKPCLPAPLRVMKLVTCIEAITGFYYMNRMVHPWIFIIANRIRKLYDEHRCRDNRKSGNVCAASRLVLT